MNERCNKKKDWCSIRQRESCKNRVILYVDPNKAESAREEVKEKIRGKRKPAWGRLEEGGRVVNTRVGTAARRKVQNCCHLMESWVRGRVDVPWDGEETEQRRKK